MKKQNEPKVKLSFDGCYNYKKLKDEGLIDDIKEDVEIIRIHTELNDDAC